MVTGRPRIKQVWKLGQKQKLEKTHTARKTRQCVYVLSAVYMTAENLLRIFLKGSRLKKNTNLKLAYDLTGLDRSSQSRMTEHSLFEPFPSSAFFSVFFSYFFSSPSLQMSTVVRFRNDSLDIESAGQLQAWGQH